MYFVGAQKQDLILLDPHQVSDSVPLKGGNDDALKFGHLSYHTNVMRKINLSKIDTTLAFGFYLRDHQDFKEFQGFLEQGKIVHKDNWPFSHFESKPKDLSSMYEGIEDFEEDLLDDFQAVRRVERVLDDKEGNVPRTVHIRQ